MPFEAKARENLEGAEHLLPADDGRYVEHSNASASRAYYAAYLAVVDRAQDRGHAFTLHELQYYRHDTLPEDALRGGLLDAEGSSDLRWLGSCRTKADYHDDSRRIDLETASYAIEVARQIVEDLLGKESA